MTRSPFGVAVTTCCLATVAALAAAPPASASGLAVAGDTLLYVAAAAELNSLTVSSQPGSKVRLSDSGATGGINEGSVAQCTHVSQTVTDCDAAALATAGVTHVNVDVADGEDTVTLAAGLAATFAYSLSGGAGQDALTGAGGDDSLAGGGELDALSGGGGTDGLYGGAGDDNLNGGDGNDTLYGAGGSDTLGGGGGDDVLAGGQDGDVFDGGTGGELFGDSVDYGLDSSTAVDPGGADPDRTAGVSARIAGGAVSGSTAYDGNGGGDGDDLIGSTVEGVAGTGFADTLTGADGDAHEILDGGGGGDTLTGIPESTCCLVVAATTS